MNSKCFFNSSDPKGHVNYCHHFVFSVVHKIDHTSLLLNYMTNWNHPWYECSLSGHLQILWFFWGFFISKIHHHRNKLPNSLTTLNVSMKRFRGAQFVFDFFHWIIKQICYSHFCFQYVKLPKGTNHTPYFTVKMDVFFLRLDLIEHNCAWITMWTIKTKESL